MNMTFTYLHDLCGSKQQVAFIRKRFFLFFLLCFFNFSMNQSLIGQCTGTANIITTGSTSLGDPAELDPNNDGFITTTGTTFVSGTDELSEFEQLLSGNDCSCEVPWTRFGGNAGEPSGDLDGSGTCGNTDIVSDGSDPIGGPYDHAYYTIFDQDGNCSTTSDIMIAFRIRVAQAASGTFSFEILVDNDGLLGNDDPDGIQCCTNSLNPGYEREIQLVTQGGNEGINVFDIDGTAGSNSTAIATFTLANSTQVANACGTDAACSSQDPVFYTFFLPLDLLGYGDCSNALTDLSVAAVSTQSGNSVINKCSSVSDVGGIDGDIPSSGCGNFTCPSCSTTACALGEDLMCASYGFVGPLPIELIYFSVATKDRQAILDWKTAAETNNFGFVIERSADARNWDILGFEPGHGTTVLTQNYSFLDSRPLPGYNYYRLKQIDFDGHFEYSDIKNVLFQSSANQKLEIFPNPNIGNFTLSLQNPDMKRAFVKLFDSTGNIIWEKHFGSQEAVLVWNKEFNLPQHEIYFVMVQVGEQVETQKISVVAKY
jgi:hypothetical protein